MRISDWSSDVCSSDLGGMASRGLGGEAALRFARDLIEKVEALAEASGIDLQVRIGIHTGPVVGGVIGSSRLAYDYWGDTMNIASRLQHAAPPGGIAVSEATYLQTRHMQDYEPAQTTLLRSEESRVGKECVRSCGFWWWRVLKKK